MADAGAGSLPGGDSALPPPLPPPPPEEQELSQRLRRLYPAVNQAETPLPRAWSPKDKYNYIGLSQGNLRVHYKGHGKNHKDAASVRATHPIPAACGIYYFEVKIVSKGRDGWCRNNVFEFLAKLRNRMPASLEATTTKASASSRHY
ncbi:UNVERIFIED_CONTAM: Ran-binding protein 10 [Gekko kuhli]